MRVIYVKEHANYPFGIGYEYEATQHKEGWLLIDGQLWREECFQVVENDTEKSADAITEAANNLSDLNAEQAKELEVYIDEFITLKAYIENFIARNNLDEDEVWEKIDEDYDEAMSRQFG